MSLTFQTPFILQGKWKKTWCPQQMLDRCEIVKSEAKEIKSHHKKHWRKSTVKMPERVLCKNIEIIFRKCADSGHNMSLVCMSLKGYWSQRPFPIALNIFHTNFTEVYFTKYKIHPFWFYNSMSLITLLTYATMIISQF